MGDIVCKFGGSSLADANQIRKVGEIVDANPKRRFIVVSAPGKRHNKDDKVTNLLYQCHEAARRGNDITPTFRRVVERYETIAKNLGLCGVSEWLVELHDHISNMSFTRVSCDWLASRGEYLCAKLVAAYLKATFVDAGDGIFVESDGSLIEEQTYNALGKLLSGGGRYVIPGFYAAKPSGGISTFARGGSDITGSIVARAVKAEVYENWTDVPGILMADPNIVKNAQPILELTYGEMRELAYMGATALQHDAVFPVREASIPIHICNTNDPKSPGTWIFRERDPSHTPQVVVGVSGLKGYSVILVKQPLMTQEGGHGLRVLEALHRHGVRHEHAPSSIDSMSVIVKDEELQGKEKALLRDIQQFGAVETVKVMPDLALIAVVGLGMAHRAGIAARVFGALAKARVNIRMINQSASEINIMVGVVEEDFEKAIRAIYREFA